MNYEPPILIKQQFIDFIYEMLCDKTLRGCKYFTGRSLINFGKQMNGNLRIGQYYVIWMLSFPKNINETLYKSNYANSTLILYALV